jgi:TfoX/Sxy family transcriptional regulator of competence genes
MAYDVNLAARIRDAIERRTPVVEKKMFGGVAFLVGGHMCCGVVANELCVRVGAARNEEALGRPHARPMDFTGKPMKGYVYVAAAGIRDARALAEWVGMGLDFVRTLPAKKPAR